MPGALLNALQRAGRTCSTGAWAAEGATSVANQRSSLLAVLCFGTKERFAAADPD